MKRSRSVEDDDEDEDLIKSTPFAINEIPKAKQYDPSYDTFYPDVLRNLEMSVLEAIGQRFPDLHKFLTSSFLKGRPITMDDFKKEVSPGVYENTVIGKQFDEFKKQLSFAITEYNVFVSKLKKAGMVKEKDSGTLEIKPGHTFSEILGELYPDGNIPVTANYYRTANPQIENDPNLFLKEFERYIQDFLDYEKMIYKIQKRNLLEGMYEMKLSPATAKRMTETENPLYDANLMQETSAGRRGPLLVPASKRKANRKNAKVDEYAEAMMTTFLRNLQEKSKIPEEDKEAAKSWRWYNDNEPAFETKKIPRYIIVEKKRVDKTNPEKEYKVPISDFISFPFSDVESMDSDFIYLKNPIKFDYKKLVEIALKKNYIISPAYKRFIVKNMETEIEKDVWDTDRNELVRSMHLESEGMDVNVALSILFLYNAVALQSRLPVRCFLWSNYPGLPGTFDNEIKEHFDNPNIKRIIFICFVGVYRPRVAGEDTENHFVTLIFDRQGKSTTNFNAYLLDSDGGYYYKDNEETLKQVLVEITSDKIEGERKYKYVFSGRRIRYTCLTKSGAEFQLPGQLGYGDCGWFALYFAWWYCFGGPHVDPPSLYPKITQYPRVIPINSMKVFVKRLLLNSAFLSTVTGLGKI